MQESTGPMGSANPPLDLWVEIIKSWKVFVACVVIGLGVTTAYFKTRVHGYVTEATIMPAAGYQISALNNTSVDPGGQPAYDAKYAFEFLIGRIRSVDFAQRLRLCFEGAAPAVVLSRDNSSFMVSVTSDHLPARSDCLVSVLDETRAAVAEEIAQNAMAVIHDKRMKLERQLGALIQTAPRVKKEREQQLAEALQIANALGINYPDIGLYQKANQSQSLIPVPEYYLGSRVLKAKLKALGDREVTEDVEKEAEVLRYNIALYDTVSVRGQDLIVGRMDGSISNNLKQDAVTPVKGYLVSLVLSIIAALIFVVWRTAYVPRKG